MAGEIQQYHNCKTVIMGEVNSGKTTLTTSILGDFIQAGFAAQIAVLDLSPEPVKGIGGKLEVHLSPSVLYLTTPIVAPRMMGKNEEHSRQLARNNAKQIEQMFKEYLKQPRELLFINDATLYLQAGRLERFLELLGSASTAVVNIYYGTTFADSELTQRERMLSDQLIEICDQIITCSPTPDIS